MKREIIIRLTIVSLIIQFWYLQYGRDVRVCSSIITSSESGYSQSICIVANKLYISDLNKFADEMVRRCSENSFEEMRFSYDINGYPKEIILSIYVNEMTWKLSGRVFVFEYKL